MRPYTVISLDHTKVPRTLARRVLDRAVEIYTKGF